VQQASSGSLPALALHREKMDPILKDFMPADLWDYSATNSGDRACRGDISLIARAMAQASRSGLRQSCKTSVGWKRADGISPPLCQCNTC
jgi:hypothetical protein